MDIKKLAEQQAKEILSTKGIEVSCPSCKEQFLAKEMYTTCPHCSKTFDVEFKINL